jgi:hypothetical protein
MSTAVVFASSSRMPVTFWRRNGKLMATSKSFDFPVGFTESAPYRSRPRKFFFLSA